MAVMIMRAPAARAMGREAFATKSAKRAEEIFGRAKSAAGRRQTKFRGQVAPEQPKNHRKIASKQQENHMLFSSPPVSLLRVSERKTSESLFLGNALRFMSADYYASISEYISAEARAGFRAREPRGQGGMSGVDGAARQGSRDFA